MTLKDSIRYELEFLIKAHKELSDFSKSNSFRMLSKQGKDFTLKQLQLQENYIACLKARYADTIFNSSIYKEISI